MRQDAKQFLSSPDSMSNFKNIECNLCNKHFEKMEVLNMHMKSIHQESDSDRIERLALTIGSALAQDSNKVKKSQDCSECGTLFSNSQEKDDHEKNHHTHGPINQPRRQV